jgi:hypothetical protein
VLLPIGIETARIVKGLRNYRQETLPSEAEKKSFMAADERR